MSISTPNHVYIWYLEPGFNWPWHSTAFVLISSTLSFVPSFWPFLLWKVARVLGWPRSCQVAVPPPLQGLDCCLECVHSGRCSACRGQTPMVWWDKSLLHRISFFLHLHRHLGLGPHDSHSGYPSAHLLQKEKRTSSHTVSHRITFQSHLPDS